MIWLHFNTPRAQRARYPKQFGTPIGQLSWLALPRFMALASALAMSSSALHHPAWGHGLWHGTLAPLALGVTTGVYAGRFNADRLMKALQDYKITNLSAAATHYRMMMNAGTANNYRFAIEKLSFTGEPIDDEGLKFVERTFRKPVCSMYGTTEIGVILVNYPGASDFAVKPGSLGKAVPNVEVEVQRSDGAPAATGEIGEIKLLRRGEWHPTKDLGYVDEDGYFYHAGRADDVIIISAGWTMSAVEIENALLAHPDINEAAAIGVPDETRGQIVKAFLVTERSGKELFVREVQEFVRNRLQSTRVSTPNRNCSRTTQNTGR